MKKNISPITIFLQGIVNQMKDRDEGKVADYIPELALADKSWLGIALATVDGKFYTVGDIDKEFTIQSISKAFTYGLALEENGIDKVTKKIQVEPSGDQFNAISLDQSGRPSNPMINAGAIASVSMINGLAEEVRAKIFNTFSIYAGRKLKIDEKVYQSESNTGHRNRAIGWMLRNFDIIENDPVGILENYFKQCSLLINCKDLALMGATLANNGVNPVTQERAINSDYIKYIFSVMTTCGMYDFSGNWLYHIGLPAKSGVGGGILAILPGELSVAIFSPPLDERGNSSKGIKVLKRISSYYNLNINNVTPLQTNSFIRASLDLENLTSSKQRSENEKEIIRKHGKKALVLIIQGSLGFSGYEMITRKVLESSENKSFVLLDINRVMNIDKKIYSLFWEFFQFLKIHNITLLFSSESKSIGLSNYFKEQYEGKFFQTLDNGLEYMENIFIDHFSSSRNISSKFELTDFQVINGLKGDDLQNLQNILQQTEYKKGDTIINIGDIADKIFFLAQGDVDVSITINGKNLKVSSIGAGNTFGEMGLTDQSLRTANITVSSEVARCFELKIKDLQSKKFLNLRLVLMNNIISELSKKLNIANKQVQKLL
ncbi:MAG: glutaminase A [Zetaproteobacteria bacterium]|nr:glutaminase A [Pseudobdellovibrionaceae bacterium]